MSAEWRVWKREGDRLDVTHVEEGYPTITVCQDVVDLETAKRIAALPELFEIVEALSRRAGSDFIRANTRLKQLIQRAEACIAKNRRTP